MDSVLSLSVRSLLPVVHDFLAAEVAHITRVPLPDFAPYTDLYNLDLQIGAVEALTAKLLAMFGLAPPERSLTTIMELAQFVDRLWDRRNITFFTSGSTGTPKACHHDYGLFIQEIKAQAEIFAGRTRVVTCVPSHHIYGFLFAVMLPLALRAGVFRFGPIPTTSLGHLAEKGDLVIAFPLFWRKMHELRSTFASEVQGVTSTGPCPAKVIVGLLGQGLQRMTEVYGSSETGGIGWRRSVDESYCFYPFWLPQKRDEQYIGLVRVLPNGEFSPPCALPDRLSACPGGKFLPMGRLDNAVQVAGMNVFAARVAEVILAHPEVEECAVRLMRPDEGNRLKAFVVLKTGLKPTAERQQVLQRWLSQVLSPPEVPRSLTFGKTLPKSGLGKQTDW